MKKLKLSAIFLPTVLSVVLSGCAHAPKPVVQSEQSDQEMMDLAVVVPSMADTEKEPVYPKQELTEEMVYTFLLADIAAQRGQKELASEAYTQLAKKTRDVRVARRAAQLGYESRQMESALDAFKLWNELDPKASMPKQMLATMLVNGGKLEDAKPYLVEMLAADPNNAGRNFVQLYPLFLRYDDKALSHKVLNEIAQPYLRFAEIHWVLAQSAEASAQHEEAMAEINQASNLRPEWEQPVLLRAQWLQATKPADAMAVLKKFLIIYPEANEVRLFYARILLDQKLYPESRLQFQQLLKAKPENSELAFAIALISIQMGELDRAENELKQTLVVAKKDSSTVHFYLGQLHEAKKSNAAALQEYQQVKDGEHFFHSRLRIAYLLVKADKLNEARAILQHTTPKNTQQSAQLILTEGQVLRDSKQYDAAYAILSTGLEKLPDHPDLLYESAMMADKLGKADTFEVRLRKLIKVDPDHAHAYNALGYSLLERKGRLEEAMRLVEKAHQLAPNDAAILDSLGWGYYLTGKLGKSAEYMRRAYITYPDPEIAAHLGEVIWKQGGHDEAKNIWQDNLKKNPDSTVLKAVIKKFIP